MENKKVWVSTVGPMENHTKGSGSKESEMDMEFGEVSITIVMLENGKEENQMDLEYISGAMVIATKGILRNV